MKTRQTQIVIQEQEEEKYEAEKSMEHDRSKTHPTLNTVVRTVSNSIRNTVSNPILNAV
jgi:hypothetical protein